MTFLYFAKMCIRDSTFTVHELALTGVMAALSLVAYLFFRVPFYGGSSFHLGNTFTALTALLLDLSLIHICQRAIAQHQRADRSGSAAGEVVVAQEAEPDALGLGGGPEEMCIRDS